MKRYLFGIWTLTALLFLSIAPEAQASALGYLKKTQAKLNRLAKANASDAKLKRIVNKLLDFDMLAESTLRKHWKNLTTKQKTEFKKAFRALLEKKYIKGIRSKAKYKVVYKREIRNGSKSKVVTEVNYTRKGRDRQNKVVYSMRKRGGRWLVFDVATDDVSMERNYRNSFNRIIRKKGFDDLLQKLEKRARKQKTRP